jgi:hypothetical protein
MEGWGRTELEVVGDDIHIEQVNDTVNISCDSDIKLSMPRGARLTVGFVGGDLKAENLDGPVELSFVGGDAILRNLKGEVKLSGTVGGETKFENVSRVSMDSNQHGPGHDISNQIQRKIEQATRRAEQRMRRADGKIKIAEHKINRHAHVNPNIDVGRWKWNVTPGSFSSVAQNEPVSDEERMTILKMLQDKKITSEQADKLLAALEGGE